MTVITSTTVMTQRFLFLRTLSLQRKILSMRCYYFMRKITLVMPLIWLKIGQTAQTLKNATSARAVEIRELYYQRFRKGFHGKPSSRRKPSFIDYATLDDVMRLSR
jgi:phage gp16-like protein